MFIFRINLFSTVLIRRNVDDENCRHNCLPTPLITCLFAHALFYLCEFVNSTHSLARRKKKYTDSWWSFSVIKQKGVMSHLKNLIQQCLINGQITLIILINFPAIPLPFIHFYVIFLYGCNKNNRTTNNKLARGANESRRKKQTLIENGDKLSANKFSVFFCGNILHIDKQARLLIACLLLHNS